MYSAFASVYDRLMADVDYSAWAAFYTDLLRRRGINRGSVCECACGTGSLTLPLSKTYDMIGVDASEEMLDIAAEKARSAAALIPFVLQDMTVLKLHRSVDAVLCTCDGVNYLEDMQQVSSFFQAAYRALRPGGALIFDVSTPYKLEHQLGDRLIGDDEDDIAFLWKNSFDAAHCRVYMYLSVFVKTADGRYRRINEEQTQYGYSRPALTNLLAAAGFTDIQIHGDRTMSAPIAAENRWHIAATRKE